jgi:5-enolpyruvylshikimate-3-phosphate synthase
MSYAVAGFIADNASTITETGSAAVSSPGFLKDIDSLGANIKTN